MSISQPLYTSIYSGVPYPLAFIQVLVVQIYTLITTVKFSINLFLFVLDYFCVQSGIFLYLDNRWILLFPMIYKSPFIQACIMEKLAVYDEEVQLSLISIDSVITTFSHFFDLNNDAPAKCKGKTTS